MRILGYPVILAMLLSLLPTSSFATGEPVPRAEKRILVIYSFTINFAPDFQLATAFNRAISATDIKLRVKHLELDAFASEDATDEALSAKLAPLLPEIRNGDFDVIIPVGQIAIDLLHRHSRDIPDRTAIAFCGLDIVTRELFQAHPNTTGSFGRVSVADNIELGLHFFPDTKRIVLLTDWSVQGRRILAAGRRNEARYPGIEYICPDNSTTGLNEMLQFVGRQDGRTLVLFYAWYNQDSTNLASLEYIMSHLERCDAPVLALQEPMLWDGAVGGVFTEVEPIGVSLAGQVEQILSGRRAADITIAALPLKTVVNWSAVRSGRIAENRIPEAAGVIGCDTVFTEANYPILIVCAVSTMVFAGLLALVTILFFRLRRLTRRTQAILRNIPETVIVSDPRERVLFIHSGEMNAYNGKADLRLGSLPRYYDEKTRQVLNQVFATGRSQRFEHEFEDRQYSVEVVGFSADIFGVEAVLWTLTDISELSQARRRLDEELQKSRLTLDSVADAVVVADADARITYLNPAACAMIGDGLCVAGGRPIDDFFRLRPEDCTSGGQDFALAEAIRNKISATRMYDQILYVPGSGTRNVIFNLSPITAENVPPIGSVLTIRDITPIKEYQNRLVAAVKEAKDANRVKSLFLATMSHELRTPLNAVIGFSEVLQQQDLPENERLEYLKSIRFAGATLLALINDILDLSKIEAGQMILTPHPTDVAGLCRELANLFKPAADKKGIDIRVEVRNPVPTLLLDDMRLRQILLNLVGNAVKFTANGGVTLAVDISAVSYGTVDLAVHVIDTGIGIREDAQTRIFEPFVQQDADRDSRVFQGTGLGLTISNRLALHMGGMIRLKSVEGSGSDFTLVLKNVGVCESGIVAEAATPEVCSGDFSTSGHILLVDDVPMNLTILQVMFKTLGVSVVTAGSGAEALAVIDRECPDIVLSDLWMPGMGGKELAREIRKNPACAHVKIFAVTADSETDNPDALVDFDGVIYKPLSLDKLRKFLTSLAGTR